MAVDFTREEKRPPVVQWFAEKRRRDLRLKPHSFWRVFIKPEAIREAFRKILCVIDNEQSDWGPISSGKEKKRHSEGWKIEPSITTRQKLGSRTVTHEHSEVRTDHGSAPNRLVTFQEVLRASGRPALRIGCHRGEEEKPPLILRSCAGNARALDRFDATVNDLELDFELSWVGDADDEWIKRSELAQQRDP